MSADNWAICPKCNKDAGEEKMRQQKAVGEAYGQVSAEVYHDLFQKAAAPVELKQTLREDYEISLDEGGEFLVDYRASCTHCGFSFKFEESKKVPL